MKRAVGILLVGVATSLTPESGHAQVASDPAKAGSQAVNPPTLVLRVRQENETPINNAELSIKSGKVSRVAHTDSNGVARVDGLSIGDIEIQVRRAGYQSAQMITGIAAGENDLVIHLDTTDATSNEIRVGDSRPVAGRLQDSGKAGTSAAVIVLLRLRQSDNSPVADAEISLKGDKTERLVRSDANGNARVEGLPQGYVEIRVRRVGFKQAQVLGRVASGDNEFTIRVDGSTVVLDELRIVGNKRVDGRLEDFEARRKNGEASSVVTLEQIDKRNPVRLSQMLRGLPGLRITDALGSAVAISTRGKNPRGAAMTDCPMRLMIDGVVMPELSDIDQVSPKAAYGIEIFNGPSTIPLKLQGMRTNQWCGLIAIWTRSG